MMTTKTKILNLLSQPGSLHCKSSPDLMDPCKELGCWRILLEAEQKYNESGLCVCGCGGKTKIPERNYPEKRWIKGKAKRFITGHNLRRIMHINQEVNRIDSAGYVRVRTKRTASNNGFIHEHRLFAEYILGKPLPDEAVIHHVSGDKTEQKGNLVICENQGYHSLLHKRKNALEACGHANWRKCTYCHQYDDLNNLYLNGEARRIFYHRECHNKYQKNKRAERARLKGDLTA